ncbi:MAG: sigma-70 family RNA polymerase sigma factor [Roseburia sp.]|nr:sigma-70 family RNA polymerase sigma factor [Roseburia sp.]MCM1097195.1 sigma-70 family RNA polymerase sigma factor [Ruminococcus flavefaciens]
MGNPNRNRDIQLKIDAYGNMLFKLCLMRLQNVQDAEDVVQDVFYQYLKREESFESEEHEKAWLLKVAVNGCRRVWRSAWKRHRSGEDWQDVTAWLSERGTEEAVPDPEDYSLEKERRQQLLNAVMALPVKYRDVIHLFYYQQLSVKAIAEITGRGQSTVTSQLTRGRELLRKSLKEEYDFA